jgi:hypothetical protein
MEDGVVCPRVILWCPSRGKASLAHQQHLVPCVKVFPLLHEVEDIPFKDNLLFLFSNPGILDGGMTATDSYPIMILMLYASRSLYLAELLVVLLKTA